MPLDLDWVAPALGVGGRLEPCAIEALGRVHRVGRVVDLRAEAVDDEEALARHAIRLLHLPTPDQAAVAPADLARGVAWIEEGLTAGLRVLVHCEHGIGRGPLMAACVLVGRGVRPDEALARVRAARPRVCLSSAQLDALLAWADARGARAGVTRDDLAAIVCAGRA